MSDTINRQDAIDAIEMICNTPCNQYFVNAIKRLPSAERKGKWVVKHDYRQTECSECQHYNPIIYECSECKHWQHIASNFCLNCGADMRGEEE